MSRLYMRKVEGVKMLFFAKVGHKVTYKLEWQISKGKNKYKKIKFKFPNDEGFIKKNKITTKKHRVNYKLNVLVIESTKTRF